MAINIAVLYNLSLFALRVLWKFSPIFFLWYTIAWCLNPDSKTRGSFFWMRLWLTFETCYWVQEWCMARCFPGKAAPIPETLDTGLHRRRLYYMAQPRCAQRFCGILALILSFFILVARLPQLPFNAHRIESPLWYVYCISDAVLYGGILLLIWVLASDWTQTEAIKGSEWDDLVDFMNEIGQFWFDAKERMLQQIMEEEIKRRGLRVCEDRGQSPLSED
jgi:hypothetical protein